MMAAEERPDRSEPVRGRIVTSWFVAKGAPSFSVIQGVLTMLLIALIVAGLPFWPERMAVLLNRSERPRA
jgi:hypothetical protein